jgi:hypothetical protein
MPRNLIFALNLLLDIQEDYNCFVEYLSWKLYLEIIYPEDEGFIFLRRIDTHLLN